MGNDEEPGAWLRNCITGTVRGYEAAVPFLERSGAGATVVTGTTAALEVVGPRRSYSAVIKSLAVNLAPKHVRANVVSPGTIYFKGGVWHGIERNRPEFYKQALARNPMGRMGSPEEVANAVVFLATRGQASAPPDCPGNRRADRHGDVAARPSAPSVDRDHCQGRAMRNSPSKAAMPKFPVSDAIRQPCNPAA
jgi:hypothetical protein